MSVITFPSDHNQTLFLNDLDTYRVEGYYPDGVKVLGPDPIEEVVRSIALAYGGYIQDNPYAEVWP